MPFIPSGLFGDTAPWDREFWEPKRIGKGFMGIGDVETELQPLPQRPSLGAESDIAVQKQSQAIQRILNQQLTRNIGQINREWAPRYFSGRRESAIEDAQAATRGQLSTAVGRTALDAYIADLQATIQRERMEDEWYWRQAQLDTEDEDGYGELGNLGLRLLMLKYGGGA